VRAGLEIADSCMRIAVVLGTRPEAVKLAPVIHALRRERSWETTLIATGQHRELLDQSLAVFGLRPDVDLAVMEPNQTLPDLTARVLVALSNLWKHNRPDIVVVQGDTTTVFAASLAAFYAGIPVAHVEAGLRTHDLRLPFPEEANRHLTSVLTTLHFAPTEWARDQLLAEAIDPQSIVVTGNTVVDALMVMRQRQDAMVEIDGFDDRHNRLLLVTSHRRETWGDDLRQICLAVRRILQRFPDVHVAYPVHPNPRVLEPVRETLGDTPRAHLLPPLDYIRFVGLMSRATIVVTDSGGVQEEAPSLGKPVLVLRQATERPEACRSGAARVIGTDRDSIVSHVSRLLTSADAYNAMVPARNPFGDGHAASRIVRVLTRWRQGLRPLLPAEEQFGASPAAVADGPRPVESRPKKSA
jgi:UDP-N-acetylglucosamine 2-epimerase (non-hydrolysing)